MHGCGCKLNKSFSPLVRNIRQELHWLHPSWVSVLLCVVAGLCMASWLDYSQSFRCVWVVAVSVCVAGLQPNISLCMCVGCGGVAIVVCAQVGFAKHCVLGSGGVGIVVCGCWGCGVVARLQPHISLCVGSGVSIN